MKKSFLLFALVLGLLPAVFGQAAELTADEIAAKYIEVTGGEEAWRGIKNIQMEAKSAMYGMEFPTLVTMSYPNHFRLDVNIQGQKMIQSFDGETAWQIMPMMGITTPTNMSEEEATSVNQSEVLPEFIDYANRGYTIELADAREIEGVATQGVKLSDGKKKTLVYYFDLETFVPIMTSTTIMEGQGKGSVVDSYMSEYDEVDGVILPFSTETKIDGQTLMKMTVQKITTNTELEPNLFSKPKE